MLVSPGWEASTTLILLAVAQGSTSHPSSSHITLEIRGLLEILDIQEIMEIPEI